MYMNKNKPRLTKMLKSFVVFCLTAGALYALPASAEEKRINIEVSKGTLVRFKEPVDNVFIADSNIADIQMKSPTLAYIFGRQQGETSLYAINKNDKIIYEGMIAVNNNLGSLEAALKRVIPGARIKVASFQGLLVMTGYVKNPDQAAEAQNMAEGFSGQGGKIINRIKIASPVQVNLRVRIAEVGRDTLKQLGFNFAAGLTDGTVGIGRGPANLFSMVDGVRQFQTAGLSSIFGGFTAGTFDFNMVIDALEQEGVLSVLAEPNLTTLSGEEAKFLAGGQYPIPTINEDGQIAVEFKSFGVSLSFKPVVLDSGLINIHIAPEVSQLSSNGAITLNGFSIPALSTRSVDTTVELGSGQSFAIAGLLQNDVNTDLQKFPFLGDLPILGALFRSSQFRRRETELVIIVTPYIVKPHKNGTMPMPTDNYKAANDAERYLQGKSYATVGPTTPPPAQGKNGQKLKSAAGFILD